MSKVYLPRADQFDLMNENLAKIANAIGSDIDISTWAGIQKAVRAGIAPDIIPVGTQLSVSHSSYGSLLFDVVAHNYFKSAHDGNAHTMTLMCHDVIRSLQYDAPEAFYYADVELPAGTYHFTIPTTYESWNAGTYQFTLNSALPAGGQLCIYDTSATSMENARVALHRSRTTAADGQTTIVPITLGDGGTNLGTFGVELNHTRRVGGGSDNYGESAIRQFLNSSGDVGDVWTPQTKFDRTPTWNGTVRGFAHGLDTDFLAVIGEVVVPCGANTVYESPDSTTTIGKKYTVKDKFYLASAREIMGDATSSVDDGTVQFTYYNGADAVDRVKFTSGTPSSWWTRSPYKTLPAVVQDITGVGNITSHYPSHSFGISPVCTIV